MLLSKDDNTPNVVILQKECKVEDGHHEHIVVLIAKKFKI